MSITNERTTGLFNRHVIILLDQTYSGFGDTVRLEGTLRGIGADGRSAEVELKQVVELNKLQIGRFQITPRYQHEKIKQLTSIFPWRRSLIVNLVATLPNRESTFLGIGKASLK